jgi:hypothetical protein
VRFKIVIACGAFALAGCVAASGTWQRLDGRIVDAAALICMAEVEKARLSAHRQRCGALACVVQDLEIKNSLSAIVKACMAERGYHFAQSP